LGTLAEDPDVVSQSRTATMRALTGGAALDPTLATVIIATASRHGDVALFDALVAAAEHAATPEEHDRYAFALGDFRDPALIDRGLELSLSPQLRSQDTAIYLSQFFGNPSARDRAWAFVKSHWQPLAPKVTIFGGDTYFIRSLNSFCDTGARDDIRSFFAAHPLPAAARTLQQTLEQIDNCIRLRERQTAAVGAWLAARR